MTTAADNARAVRDRYAGRLTEVVIQLAADAAANPKAAPDQTLTEARWKLLGRARLADELCIIFEEEGL